MSGLLAERLSFQASPTFQTRGRFPSSILVLDVTSDSVLLHVPNLRRRAVYFSVVSVSLWAIWVLANTVASFIGQTLGVIIGLAIWPVVLIPGWIAVFTAANGWLTRFISHSPREILTLRIQQYKLGWARHRMWVLTDSEQLSLNVWSRRARFLAALQISRFPEQGVIFPS